MIKFDHCCLNGDKQTDQKVHSLAEVSRCLHHKLLIFCQFCEEEGSVKTVSDLKGIISLPGTC